jgi:hypothetical protein
MDMVSLRGTRQILLLLILCDSIPFLFSLSSVLLLLNFFFQHHTRNIHILLWSCLSYGPVGSDMLIFHTCRALLGSVSDYCAKNVKCPVVIVKHPEDK